jgi:hypothetical protein
MVLAATALAAGLGFARPEIVYGWTKRRFALAAVLIQLAELGLALALRKWEGGRHRWVGCILPCPAFLVVLFTLSFAVGLNQSDPRPSIRERRIDRTAIRGRFRIDDKLHGTDLRALWDFLMKYLSAVLLVALATATWPAQAAETELQEYLVIGTVVWVHPGSSSISIRGSSLLGRLRLDEKSYRVKQPGTLLDLHPGDRITAAFSRKDGMLHRLKRVRSAAKSDSH